MSVRHRRVSDRRKCTAYCGTVSTRSQGFKDYGCSYEITARQVFGAVTGCVVWQVEGWNEDSDGEETDILKSDFFGAEEDSNACCLELQKVHNRSNWVVDKHIIDKCSWEAGFSRYYY